MTAPPETRGTQDGAEEEEILREDAKKGEVKHYVRPEISMNVDRRRVARDLASATAGTEQKIIKVLQINLGRRRDAHDLAISTALEKGYDILAISEPNIKKARDAQWQLDERGDTAIVIVRGNLPARSGKGQGHTWVEVGGARIISVYVSPNTGLKALVDDLSGLQRTMAEAQGDCIVAGDLNAKSEAWGSNCTDQRGDRKSVV